LIQFALIVIKTFWRLVTFVLGFVERLGRFAVGLIVLPFLVAGIFFAASSIFALLESSPQTFSSSLVAEETVLRLELNGRLVEQADYPRSRFLPRQIFQKESQDIEVRDIVRLTDALVKDPRVDDIVLDLSGFEGGSLTSLRLVAQQLQRLKDSGKTVLAWGLYFGQAQYYLAAHASKVYLHPKGILALEGIGQRPLYLGAALARLGIEPNLIRAGQFKDAAEPLVRASASKESLTASERLLDDLWRIFASDIARARAFEPNRLDAFINDLPRPAEGQGFDPAQYALKAGLVDDLLTPDAFEAQLQQNNQVDKVLEEVTQVHWLDYLQLQPEPGFNQGVAIVVAQGAIFDGEEAGEGVGGLSTAALIREARLQDGVRALVVRIDSPGGSVVGSELIRRELEVTRQMGIPVVASMAGMAASGGYWIAAGADAIVAEESTITGSIGVFALFPTASKALSKLDINTDGYTTHWLRGAYDPRRPLDPRLKGVLQASVNQTYDEFIGQVAQARKLSKDRVDQLAQGQVWTGAQAHQRGLVDQLGGLDTAVRLAAEKAGLTQDFDQVYVEPAQPVWSALLSEVLRSIKLELLGGYSHDLRILQGLLGLQGSDLRWLSRLSEPQASPLSSVQAHCLCSSELF
jgi:protease-4